MGQQPRIIRSLVFVPAHEPDRIREVAGRGMDGLCLDLEDLTPLDAKAEARRIFPDLAAELDGRGIAVFARINGLTTGMTRDDLGAVVGPHVHCVSVPKVTTAAEVVEYDRMLAEIERDKGLEPGSVLVRPIVETALGIKFAYEIAAASPRVAYMGGVAGGWWGDLSSSLGYVPTPEGRETFYLRSKVLVDVRAAGVPFPIGGGTTTGRDRAAVAAFAAENRQLGYDGMHCSDNAEVIEVVNQAFTPSPADLESWLAQLPRLEAAEREGRSAVVLDGRFMDLAGLVRVRQQLDLARRLGMIPPG